MIFGAAASVASVASGQISEPLPTYDRDGTIHVPAHSVPQSPLVSAGAKAGNIAALADNQRPLGASIAEMRARIDADIAPVIARARAIYPVDISHATIDGVYTESITPAGGVSAANRSKVLIELHGGGFFAGARTGGRSESIPVAALSGLRVVAVDYRQAPEARYPAATEDAATVYRALLKHYRPENIGIFGCSAGGILTAELVAWAQSHGLPRPGAISIACAGAGVLEGDSSYVGPPLNGMAAPRPGAVWRRPYFAGVDTDDAAVSPVRSPAMLAKFPPTLILSGTRDFALSAAVYSHAQLVKAGVEADLHVWEGLGHGFHTIMPEAPESREANGLIARFFLKHLGRSTPKIEHGGAP